MFEEVGFDKILEKLGRLRELEVVLLDGMKIVRGDGVAEVLDTCPSEFGYAWDREKEGAKGLMIGGRD